MYIPPGVAHGFAALTDILLTYLVDNYYDPSDELGLAWDDPAVGPTGASATPSSPSATSTTRVETTSPTTSGPNWPTESGTTFRLRRCVGRGSFRPTDPVEYELVLIGGVVAVMVVVGLAVGMLVRRRSHDDVHSVAHYHRQLHTLEEMRTHIPSGSAVGHQDGNGATAFPTSAFRVSGSSTVRLTESGEPPAPSVPPPSLPNPSEPAAFDDTAPEPVRRHLHERHRGPGDGVHEPPPPSPGGTRRRGRLP